MGKKRKLEVLDPDAEKTLYTSFVTAANSISSLYTQAVQQQRKSSAQASRLTVERIAHFVMREYPGEEHVPKAALLHFLHQEYEGIDGAENLPHQFPVAMFPVVQQGASGNVSESAEPVESPGATLRSAQAGSFLAPSGRRSVQPAAAMDTMEHYAEMHDTHASDNTENQQLSRFGLPF